MDVESGTISVLVFGPMARVAGDKRLVVRVEGGTITCGTLREGIRRQYPGLATLLGACRFAVNGEFAEEGRVVGGAEEIALIGLVSGG